MSTVYSARVTGTAPAPDEDEVSELRWFSGSELAQDPDMGSFASATFRALGWI